MGGPLGASRLAL